MIVVTGAAGFIGSALLARLLELGYGDLVAVDDFSPTAKIPNLKGKKLREMVHRDAFIPWLHKNGKETQLVFHIGARTDTSEFDEMLLNRLNLEYSREVWNACVEHSIPLIYASSAATYGAGEHGFDDDVRNLQKLQPLNAYGWSKHRFDMWVQEQSAQPPFWAGFKFFNVFGPNEFHKERMASVVYHAFRQISATGKVKLFRSHRQDFTDGQQLRDFIYVKDVLEVLVYFMENRKFSDLYNLGTGTSRSFSDLATAVFHATERPVDISFIDIPEDIRNTYQYYTQANMAKVRYAGYEKPFTSLETGISEYVREYLLKENHY